MFLPAFSQQCQIVPAAPTVFLLTEKTEYQDAFTLLKATNHFVLGYQPFSYDFFANRQYE